MAARYRIEEEETMETQGQTPNVAHAGAQGPDERRIPSDAAHLLADPALAGLMDYGTAG